MANETGHAKNIENFLTLINFVTSWGVAYDPSNAAIELAALNALHTNAIDGMGEVTTALMPHKAAINDRETEYLTLRPLATRVINLYKSTGTAQNNIDDAMTYARKIQGKRVSVVIEDDPLTPEDESQQSHSASQQSYSQLAEHLDNLIAVLNNDPLYAPNESALTVVTLQTLATSLKAKNNAVGTTRPPVVNARATRNGFLYSESSGIFDIAKMVKAYVKAAFGASSPEYNAISGLKFTDYKTA